MSGLKLVYDIVHNYNYKSDLMLFLAEYVVSLLGSFPTLKVRIIMPVMSSRLILNELRDFPTVPLVSVSL